MEPGAAAWVPCNFKLANWTMEPAAGFPAESESTEKHGNWIQTCVPNSGGGQLVEYYAATTQQYPVEKKAQESLEVVVHNKEMEIYDIGPSHVFDKVVREFRKGIDIAEKKMHRYPENIRDLGDWYTVPRTVAIGPYHHDRQQLKKAEQVKHVAADHCIRDSQCSAQEICDAVLAAAAKVRHLYDKDVMKGIGYDDFWHMMFFDACFLVQYMIWHGREQQEDPWLDTFFYSNRNGINHDVWLLENQLPWKVVKTVMDMMKVRQVNLRKFVARWRDRLHDRQDLKEKPLIWDDSYKPPHLLGLLRYYIVGGPEGNQQDKDVDVKELTSLSFSVSAIELAKIGITLTANKTAELADMGLNNGILDAKLSLAPLSLNYARASRLINMAAFEICFLHSTDPLLYDIKYSAVCSYLHLLSMLVQREEDVHELRRQGILEGGAGLNNKQVLDLFTCFQSLPEGKCYSDTMVEIERYKMNRKILSKGHTFWYKYNKIIFGVGSAIGSVYPIVKFVQYLVS
ncbi:hypothetical protein BS78_05G055100 [Paspalum vaginatum]|nr:hypothetical protein BS78_05G055100 [Paspalum vaginatum]